MLVDLYVRRGLSSEAIAHQLGCSSQKVRSDLRYRGIELRGTGAANPGLAELDLDTLRHLYLDLGLTIQRIAERHSCSGRAVANRLADYGIPARSRAGLPPGRGSRPAGGVAARLVSGPGAEHAGHR